MKLRTGIKIIIKKAGYILFLLVKTFFSGIIGILKGIKKRFRFSITFKITVVYAFLFTTLLFLISFSVITGSAYFLMQQARQDLQKSYYEFARIIEERPHNYEAALTKLVESSDFTVNLFDKKKKLIFTTNPQYKTLYQGKPQRFAPFLAYSEEIIIENQPHFLQGIRDVSNERIYIGILMSLLIVSNGIALVITLMMGARASKKMLKPIEKMTKTAQHISVNALDTRLDVSGAQDELKELAETFNEMLDRIEASYRLQNQFVSDASHELRTPIAVIQGYSNMLDRWGKEDPKVLSESIEAIKSESEAMKDLIEKLLFLARADKNLEILVKEDFSLDGLIDEVIRDTRLIDSSKHQILCEVNDPATLNGDRKSIKQLLRILIDNSLKFTPPGGRITINLIKSRKQAVIEIIDTGIGIAQEDLPHIFERFYRADKSRTKEMGGQGLGLSIAKWIIHHHGGKISVESKLQVGTKIKILLPIQA